MLKGLGNLGDMAKMMAKAQEFQAKMAEAQAAVEALEVEGEAGAGLVKAWVSGKGELKRLKIDPSLVNPGEVEVLEDLIVAACADAKAKSESHAAEQMSKITGDLPLPPGMKLF